MIIVDEKDGPLYTYIAKDVKAVEIAIKWIQNCPGAILYVPEYSEVPIFYFGKEMIEKLIENLFPHSNLMYVVKRAGEEGFWDDFDKEQEEEAKRIDEIMDELDETEGFDEEIHMIN